MFVRNYQNTWMDRINNDDMRIRTETVSILKERVAVGQTHGVDGGGYIVEKRVEKSLD